MTTAEKIAAHLQARGWTEYYLGQRAGVPAQTVYNAVHGKRMFADTLARLAAALGVSVEELMPDVELPDVKSRPRGRPRKAPESEEEFHDA